MTRTRVHLIAFTLVAVLCVCMVTGLQPEENESPTLNGVTHSTNSSNTTLSESALVQGDVFGNHNEYKLANTSTPTHESTLHTTTSRDTPPHHTTNKHAGGHIIDTHSEHSNTQPEDITIGTTTESIAKGPSTEDRPSKGPTTKEPSPKSSTPSGSDNSGKGAGSHNSGKGAGIFFLLLILIIIIFLAAMLYILWKKGKRYSFDLTNGEHETPLRSIDYGGTFEPTKGSNMNLDYIQEDNPDKSNPVANGCSGEIPDQAPCFEKQNAPEEDSFPSDLSLNSPVKKVEFNLDLELIGGESELVKQATEEPTDNDNENNNNDTSTGNDSADDFFTEINLDDAQ